MSKGADETRARQLGTRVARECLAVRLRMVNRVISRLYDDALRPHGLRVSQMNVLTAVARTGRVIPTRIGEALRLDKSTLSREVSGLCARGWLMRSPGKGGRRPHLQLTPSGLTLLERVTPAWEAAQRRAKALLGPEGVASVERIGRRLSALSGATD